MEHVELIGIVVFNGQRVELNRHRVVNDFDDESHNWILNGVKGEVQSLESLSTGGYKIEIGQIKSQVDVLFGE